MKYRNIQILAVIHIFFFIFMPAFLCAQEHREPGKLIMNTVDKSLSVLRDPLLQDEIHQEERRLRLWEAISPVFNFEEMAKRSLGIHWRSRTPEERALFVELFTKILKDTYAGKIDIYSGEEVIYLSERQEDSIATVRTRFIVRNEQISVDYRLLRHHGEWKIYDVIIEGVSLVNNYRSQFNSILLRSSFDDLVQRLRERIG
ncbi:MAG: MlaC/ttg2D family ABC transporter substrate-binding protein [Candidatus Loosdrechtia sp.]|uniref:MlaC/ttg2D family ABC transporter substrate-binding protein n=1 Tax=Candidatus Loosdrechtia sp. TaxID=3101272 RepID=UPI003A6B2771|nr:MAG: ABC transporter substrate-binding protein [Candidatus Jettenia sp. AMX2]